MHYEFACESANSAASSRGMDRAEPASAAAPPVAPPPVAPEAARRAIAARRQARKYPLSLTPRQMAPAKGLCDLALDVIAPWHRDEYPGRMRAWTEISLQPYSALRDFRRGRRKIPIATLERVIAAVEARTQLAVATLAKLKAERERLKALPPRQTGFCAVDPLTGHDKRYRGRKKLKKARND